MGEMRRFSVELNAREVALVDRLLAENRFRDQEEVLRYAIMLLQNWIGEQDEEDRLFKPRHTDHEIRQLWDEGVASGPPIDGNFNLEEIRDRGLARLAEVRAAQSRAA